MKLPLLGHTKKVIGCLMLFVSTLLSSSCSQNDDQTSPEPSPIHITVLGRDANAIMQVNVDDDTRTSFNLTNTLGIPVNSRLMSIHNYESLLGYYHFPPGNQSDYNVWEKNMDINQAMTYSGFCNESTIETPYFPQVSENYITVFTAELISTGNRILNIRIYNKALNICIKTGLGITDQFQELTRLIIGDFILSYHINNQDQAVISKIDLQTGALEEQLTLNTEAAVTVRGNVLYVYPISGDYNQLSYSIESFNLMDSLSFGTSAYLNPGLFLTDSVNNSILIEGNYSQPFQFTTFPALLNQEDGSIEQLADLAQINNNLIAFLNADLAIELSQKYTVDLGKNLVIGSYTQFNFDLTIIHYGVYYSDFSGSILMTVPLDFDPEKIILR